MLWAPAITALAALVLIAGRLAGHHTLAGFAKMTASTGFLITAFTAGVLDAGPYGMAILAGLIFGWFGDLFLIPKGSKRVFLAGLISFLLGHLGFLAALAIHGFSAGTATIALGIFALFGIFFYRWLKFSEGSSMRVAVMAYIAVITAMAALGVATWGTGAYRWLIPGSLLFYASDIGVALDRFSAGRFPAYVWSLPLYYGGQTCFALSVGAVA